MRKAIMIFSAIMASAPAACENKIYERDEQPTMLVGILSEQWDRLCNGTQEADWIRPHLEVGFVRLVPNTKVDFKPYFKKPVVLQGGVPKDYVLEPVKHTGDCPGMQARNDWVFGKSGVRVLRSKPKGASSIKFFQADKVTKFSGLDVKKVGDKLEVTFENSLAKPLSGVAVSLHYEGCYGKPGAPTKTKELGPVKPGQEVTVPFDVLYSMEMQGRLRGLQHHVAYSVQITTTSKEVVFDLDWPLHHLGLKCPEREGKK
jgi:hypothetical protein